MTTLSRKLLDIYDNNEDLHKMFSDLNFVSICKDFLTHFVRNTPTNYFSPYIFEKFSEFEPSLALEVLLTLAEDDKILEKFYVVECENCGSEIMEKTIEDLFYCRNVECNFNIPEPGEVLFDFIKENVFYKFAIQKDIRPLIVHENSKTSTLPTRTIPANRESNTKIKKLFEVTDGSSENPLKNTKAEQKSVLDYSFDTNAAL